MNDGAGKSLYVWRVTPSRGGVTSRNHTPPHIDEEAPFFKHVKVSERTKNMAMGHQIHLNQKINLGTNKNLLNQELCW
jgi:hypothetical protein